MAVEAPKVQTKLAVAAPGDALEIEADRVAEQVMRMPDDSEGGGTDSSIAMEALRILYPEYETDLIQPKRGTGAAPQVGPELARRVEGLGTGEVMAPDAREFFESRFGRDFGSVRIHTDAGSSATAIALNALAYTKGAHIVFAPGRYQPGTASGARLLAHELTHVVQQTAPPRTQARPQGERPLTRTEGSAGVDISRAPADRIFRHTKADCDEDYEYCCDGCRRMPNRTKADKARRALCWSGCMASYATCLATSVEALTFAAIVAAIVLAAADGPFPIGDAAAAALLISLGIVGS